MSHLPPYLDMKCVHALQVFCASFTNARMIIDVSSISKREREREREIRDCVCMCGCCISQILAQMCMCCSPIVLDNCFAHSTSRSIIDHLCRIRTRRGDATTTTTCQINVHIFSPPGPATNATGHAPFVAITSLAHTTGRFCGGPRDALTLTYA